LKTVVNKHRVREVQKYLDHSVLHLDLIKMTHMLELQPDDAELSYDWSFPRTEDDYKYLASLPDRQVQLLKDYYRRKDQKTLGFTIEYSDKRTIGWGTTAADRANTMRFKD